MIVKVETLKLCINICAQTKLTNLMSPIKLICRGNRKIQFVFIINTSIYERLNFHCNNKTIS